MCNCSNFVGATPFVNKPLNSFDGAGSFHSYANGAGSFHSYSYGSGLLRDNCDGMPCSCNKSNTVVYGADGAPLTMPPSPQEQPEEEVKRDWVDTLLPIVDKIVGVERAPAAGSSFSTDPNKAQEESSSKALWYVAGVVVALIIIFVIIKVMNKNK